VLDLMRKHAKSWLIKLALGGVIVVFIFWYGWSGPGDKSKGYLAKVNGTVIAQDYYFRTYDSELEKIRMRFKGQIPPGLLEKLDLKKNVAMGLIHRLLLLQEGHRLGLYVTDEDLREDILTNPLFQRGGMFDEGVYRDYLQRIKLTPAVYEEDRRKQMLEEQVARLLTDSVKTDPGEIKRFWHFQNDKLVLSLLMVEPEQEQPKEPADTKDLEAYFKDHHSKYAIPPAVDLQYVIFSWRDIAKQLSATDEEVQSYYNMNPKEFLIPEKLAIRHILLKIPADAGTEKKDEVLKHAQEIRAKIVGGEDFAKVAQQVSDDEATKEKGGDLGLVSRGSLSPSLEKAATNLEKGAVSEPVLTDQGYELLKVDEKQPETQLSFDAVKEKIADKLVEEKARKKVNIDADAFYEQVYRTEDLEAAAKQFALPVRIAESVTKQGGIPELMEEPKVATEAFELKPGEVSRLIRSGDNFVVFRVTKIIQERTPDFAEVRSQVEKDYSKEQSAVRARKKATEIIDELKKSPQDPVETAKKFGLTWQTLEPVSRTAGFVPQLGSSEEVNEMLTTLCEPAPLFPSPIPAQKGIAVVRLSSIQPADEAQYAKEAPMVERWVREVRQTEFLKGWLRLFEKKSEIELNDKML
jgi:peptidyl-prolyl cis-trans isomerase D